MKQSAQIKKKQAAVKTYRQQPGLFDNAVYAALHYAIKHNKEMYIIPGNSYMHKVFHLDYKLDMKKYFLKPGNNVGVVYPDGKVYQKTL